MNLANFPCLFKEIRRPLKTSTLLSTTPLRRWFKPASDKLLFHFVGVQINVKGKRNTRRPERPDELNGPGRISEDISRAKEILEEIIGDRVLGYRAPSFSITPWAVDIIKEVGYQYDSSLMPASVSVNRRYGSLQELGRLMETKRFVETGNSLNPTNPINAINSTNATNAINATNPINSIPLRRWNSACKNPRFHFVGGVDDFCL